VGRGSRLTVAVHAGPVGAANGPGSLRGKTKN
jgi:hypothetical protein